MDQWVARDIQRLEETIIKIERAPQSIIRAYPTVTGT